MKEIITSILVLSLLSCIARFILPRINRFVQWLIKVFVKNAEKKVKGSNLGKLKKDKVLKWLKWFGIHSSQITEELIENAVDVLNSKNVNIKDNILSNEKEKFNNEIDKFLKH